MWLVEYYEKVDGEKPAYDFINSLSVKMRAKAAWEMTVLSEMGTQIQKPYSKPIRDGILNCVFKRKAMELVFFTFL